MSDVKWTPGPWTIHEEPRCEYKDGAVDEGGFRIDASGIEQLAYVWRANKRWAPAGQPEAATPFGATEAEANALLIASAPDMYEALQAAVDCGMAPKSSASDGGAVRYAEQVRVADMIRAALRKARGEQ